MAGVMATCDACGPLEGPNPCRASHLVAPGNAQASRVPFGGERHLLVVDPMLGDLAPACPTCRAPRGGFHHARCRLEECPTCSGGAWSCRCTSERLVVM
jgi:hypothetical protein